MKGLRGTYYRRNVLEIRYVFLNCSTGKVAAEFSLSQIIAVELQYGRKIIWHLGSPASMQRARALRMLGEQFSPQAALNLLLGPSSVQHSAVPAIKPPHSSPRALFKSPHPNMLPKGRKHQYCCTFSF